MKRYLIRVDDFPRVDMNLNDFNRFDLIMKRFGIPYLLGVTPYSCLDPLNPKSTKFRKLTKVEIKTLRNLKNVELAMHGVTHQTHDYGYLRRLLGHHSEFEGLDRQATSDKLEMGFRLFEEYKLKKPRVFISPFNRFDEENLEVFKKCFKFITGGPETKRTIKKKNVKELILSDSPHYGISYNIFLGPNNFESDEYCCITLHWGWEVVDNFSALKRLLVQLKGNVKSWRELK